MKNKEIIYGKLIAERLGAELIGLNLPIYKLQSLHMVQPNTLSFISRPIYSEPCIGATFIISKHKKCIYPDANSYIVHENPRSAMAKIAGELFFQWPKGNRSPSARISNESVVPASCYIGENCVIEPGVELGENAWLGSNVVIKSGTKVGNRVKIGSGVVLGEDGLGCCYYDKQLIDMPHFGGVLIADDVVIGPNSCIQKGTFSNTTIGEQTKISQMVSVGHNSSIGKRNQLAGMAHVSGSVIIGDDNFIGANSSLKDGICIGCNTVIGIGEVIRENVADGQTVWTKRIDI